MTLISIYLPNMVFFFRIHENISGAKLYRVGSSKQDLFRKPMKKYPFLLWDISVHMVCKG